MELRHFKLITAIHETGSLTKAADKLFLTQSALSHQLKEIEDSLDTKLFTRVNKKMVLTDVGKIFLQYSDRIMNEVKNLERDIARQVKGETGVIRVTTESATCYHWLPKILKNYYNEFPNMDVQLKVGPVNTPLKQLMSGKVDVAIMHRRVVNKNITYLELLNDELVTLVATSHPLAAKPYLMPKDFLEVNYITHSRKIEESAFYETFLKPHHVLPKKVTYILLTETLISMVKEGLGVAVMAPWLARPYLESGGLKAIRISKNGLHRKWFIATLKNETSRPLLRFIEHLKGITI